MRDLLKFYRLSEDTFYDCINIIYQFIKPFLDNKMSIFEEYGAFNDTSTHMGHFVSSPLDMEKKDRRVSRD